MTKFFDRTIFNHLNIFSVKKVIILFVLIVGVSLYSCQQSGFKKTKSGVEYKIVDAHKGPKAKIGDFMKVRTTTSLIGNSRDTMLSPKDMEPQRIQLQKPINKYDAMEVLALLSEGDSAVLEIPADSVIPEGARPPFIKKGDKLKMTVKVLSIQTAQQMQDDMKKAQDDQMTKDEKIIQDYLAKNNLQATKTSSGVYIVIQKEGTGPTPTAGQSVKFDYTGKTLDGKAFDSSIDTASQIMHHPLQPLNVIAGNHQVLPGMDDALMQLKKGAVATMYIPSGLAYGPNGSPPVIQPNAVLAFDVHILDISDANKNK